MVALCGQDRDIIKVWREHGIPLDRTTVDYAATIIDRLALDLAEVHAILHQLLDGREPVCAACSAVVEPPLPLDEVA